MASISVEEEEEECLPCPPWDEGAFFVIPTSMDLSKFFDGIDDDDDDDDGNLLNGGEFNKNQENGREGRTEEEGLPSPPWDEGAFFVIPTSMDLSKFFDGIDDDDGNSLNGGEFNKNRENGRERRIEEESVSKKEVRPIKSNGDDNENLLNGGEVNKNRENGRERRTEEESVSKKEVRPSKSNGDDIGNLLNGGEFNKNRENGRERRTEEESVSKKEVRPSKSNGDDIGNLLNGGEFNKKRENGRERRTEEESVSKKEVRPIKSNGAHNNESGLGRPKVASQTKIQQKTDRGGMQKKTIPHRQQEKLNINNEDTKLEATKRKMQECYKEVENAKKRRRIQLVEFSDLPKQNFPQKKQQTRTNTRLRTRGL